MKFLNKMERKIGKFAISNLIIFLIGGYAIGYAMSILAPFGLSYMTLDPYYILQGQIWRIFTWILVPPQTSLFFMLIMMLFYYQLGQALERTWGVFRFNVYIFGGMLFTILGAFFIYGFFFFSKGVSVTVMGNFFSTNYINMSIFLAFAASYPEMEVRLYFLIPIKMKWMAVVYGVLLVSDLVQGNWYQRVAIIMSVLNFIIFFLVTQNNSKVSYAHAKRRKEFHQQINRPIYPSGNGLSKHKCAICGRTEIEDPTLEFRFCSKCEGNFEYCQDHLFTHPHIKRN